MQREQLTKLLRLTLVFMWNRTEKFNLVSQKSLISVFQELSASINKTFVFAGRLGTMLSFYEF